jgi:CubicO group peptidase (beta-lactamase class C family)
MRTLRNGLAAALSIAALQSASLHAQAWQQVRDPRTAGFDPSALERARRHADSVGSAAVMLVHKGRVIVAWGDVARPLMAHSVRKSLLGGLVGMAVARGELRLDATLAQLDIDDEPKLTEAERNATLRDLIASRSGVYHATAYADQGQDAERPPRGSHAPGTHFFYNNWDFNATELAVKNAGGGDIYRLYADRLARPIGMEDFDPARHGLEVYEPSNSLIPAHTIRMSTRDLARYGELIRNEGNWNGTQVVPAEWIRQSTARHTDLGDGAGYGWLWWTWEVGAMGERFPTLTQHRLIMARGTGGQVIFVVPSLEMVMIHRGDTDNGSGVRGPAIWALLEQLAAAKVAGGEQNPTTGPLTAVALASNRPAPAPIAQVSLSADQRAELVGGYALNESILIRVFEFRGRLFLNVPGMGEAELTPTGPSGAALQSDRTVSLAWERDGSGRVIALMANVGGQRMRAVKRP